MNSQLNLNCGIVNWLNWAESDVCCVSTSDNRVQIQSYKYLHKYLHKYKYKYNTNTHIIGQIMCCISSGDNRVLIAVWGMSVSSTLSYNNMQHASSHTYKCKYKNYANTNTEEQITGIQPSEEILISKTTEKSCAHCHVGNASLWRTVTEKS